MRSARAQINCGQRPAAARIEETIDMRSAIIALAMFAYLATLAPAAAHAMLVSSQPQDSQILPTSPREIVLGFNEAVVPLVLQLTDPYGAATKLSNFVVRGRSVIIPLPMEFGQGTNVLS